MEETDIILLKETRAVAEQYLAFIDDLVDLVALTMPRWMAVCYIHGILDLRDCEAGMRERND